MLGCRAGSGGVGRTGARACWGGGPSPPNWPPALPCPLVVTARDSVSPARSDSQDTAGGVGPGYAFWGGRRAPGDCGMAGLGVQEGALQAQQHRSTPGYGTGGPGMRLHHTPHPSAPGRRSTRGWMAAGAGWGPGPGCAGCPPGGWQVAGPARPRCGLHSCLHELLSNALPSSSSEMQIPPGWGEDFCFSLRPNLAPVGARCLRARFNNENRNNAI